MKIGLHGYDWCHTCKKRTAPLIDVFYDDKSGGSHYLRTCVNCVKQMLDAFPSVEKYWHDLVLTRLKSMKRQFYSEEDAFNDVKEILKDRPDFNEKILKQQVHYLWEAWDENVGIETPPQ